MTNTGILTGQYVHIEQPAASVGDRIWAQIFDWFIEAIYAFAMFILSSEVLHIDSYEYFFFGVVLPITFYPLLCEMLNQGQTVGKMFCKTRVVMIDGSSPSLGAYLLRWLLMIVDGPLLSYMGVIFILASKHHQRLGDMVAGTVVIKLQSYDRNRISLDDYAYLSKNYKPAYPAAAELSLEQVNLIDRTLKSGHDERIDQLAEKVEKTLDIRRREPHTDTFLQHLLRDYHYYALEAV